MHYNTHIFFGYGFEEDTVFRNHERACWLVFILYENDIGNNYIVIHCDSFVTDIDRTGFIFYNTEKERRDTV